MTTPIRETDRIFSEEHHRWCAYMATKGFQCMSAEVFAANAYEVIDGVIRFKNGGQKNVDERQHACLVSCNGKYHPIGKIVSAYLQHAFKNEPSGSAIYLLEGMIKELKNQLDDPCDEEQIYRACIACAKRLIFLTQCGKALGAEIQKKISDKGKNNSDLEKWLEKLFPFGIYGPEGEETDKIDALDRLSLIVTMFMTDEASGNELSLNYQDFKMYDFKIAQNLVRTIYQHQILDECERCFVSRGLAGEKPKDRLKDLGETVEKFVRLYKMDQIPLEKGKIQETETDIQYYLISQSEEFNVFLFEKGERCPVKQFSRKENYTYVYTDDKDQDKFLLAMLPKGKKVKLGTIENGNLFVVWNSIDLKGSNTGENKEAKRPEEERKIKFFQK